MRDTTNQYTALDVRYLQRNKLLFYNSSFPLKWHINNKTIAEIQVRVKNDYVILSYSAKSHNGAWEKQEYPVQLVKTPCNFGGERFWFICPAMNCGRRAAILYGGKIFACRYCYDLAYLSQRENRGERGARRAEKIRNRLGWKPGILNPRGGKPKGMHWRTFERLKLQHAIFFHKLVLDLRSRGLNV